MRLFLLILCLTSASLIASPCSAQCGIASGSAGSRLVRSASIVRPRAVIQRVATRGRLRALLPRNR